VPGDYVKDFIRSISAAQNSVQLRVREYHPDVPLTDNETGQRIAQTVSPKYRQVFLWPDEWKVVPQCSIASCEKRACDYCENWLGLPVIDAAHVKPLHGCGANLIMPAYWVVPRRCYLHKEHKGIATWTYRCSHIFEDFKLGEKGYAYPLALGMYEALRRRDALDFQAIVPIPLSPDKVAAKELHRTRLLSTELARLLGVGVKELLLLSAPISKRRMNLEGHARCEFEDRYYRFLQVDPGIADYERILLVDDVITHGLTLRVATAKLRSAKTGLVVSVASAAQMIVKAAVADERGFVS
jgi:predicted amidophosphoribosyltransferase